MAGYWQSSSSFFLFVFIDPDDLRLDVFWPCIHNGTIANGDRFQEKTLSRVETVDSEKGDFSKTLTLFKSQTLRACLFSTWANAYFHIPYRF